VQLQLSELPVQDGFRLRGESVSRLETFVDAAFAFAVTMMVISIGELPKSVADLMLALHHAPTFAATFAILMIFWTAHNRWSRRYGLETTGTTFLSLLFILLVMIWIHPLRMVMDGALSFMTGGWVPAVVALDTPEKLQGCFLIYGLGFAALSGVMVQLDRIALEQADELYLDALERLQTKRDLGSHTILLASGVLSITLTFFLHHENSIWSASPGFVYWLIGPAMHFHHSRFNRLRKALPPRRF